MFGKYSKKKVEGLEPSTKPTQKNDQFILRNGSHEKNLDHKKFGPESNSKTSTLEHKSTLMATEIEPNTFSGNSDNLTSQTTYTIPEYNIKDDKSQILLLEIEKLYNKTIQPVVDFNDNCLFYPILSKIGHPPDDFSLLEDLASDGILKKEILEKLIVCPIHHNSFSSSVKLYCPKCNSLDVEKLNLYEHKRCGFITENTEYDFSNAKNSTCPSCKRKIVDFKKEIRVPAMWHQCIECKEKFDNAIIKMYCRKYNHDFDINSGQFITTYSYKLKDYDIPITSNDENLRKDLVKLLSDFNFSTDFNFLVQGKSGNHHKFPIYAKNNSNGDAITVFIDRGSEKLSQSDINSILIPILDVSPKHILILSTSEIEEGVMPIAKQYGIQIIVDSDLSKIIKHVNEFVSKNYSKNGEK